jgi:predicted nucleotide-binding protein
MPKTKTELLNSVLEELDLLKFGDETARDALTKRTAMLLRRICGERSHYVADLGRIDFHPTWAPASEDEKRSSWNSAVGRVRNLINTIKEEIDLFDAGGDAAQPVEVPHSSTSGSIFIVHGHDEELKQSVARTIERLGFHPLILHEKPNKGRTIIEKFDDYSKVGFAVVLLSADDAVRGKNGAEDSYRARQNVMFEMGFFLGRLGREKVVAVYKPHEYFEMPSDYSGVLFVEYDKDGAWRYKLAKELKACGYTVNVDAIL